jgi:hypothetical protein
MEERWLVCKYCHQVRWAMVQPYYLWGIGFMVFAWWSLTQKVIISFPGVGDLLTVMLPILGAILGVIGVVMLFIAGIATLRGLSRK